MDILVLGVGNPILTDDAVGFRSAHMLKEAKPELTVIEATEVGLTLLELVTGYDGLLSSIPSKLYVANPPVFMN